MCAYLFRLICIRCFVARLLSVSAPLPMHAAFRALRRAPARTPTSAHCIKCILHGAHCGGPREPLSVSLCVRVISANCWRFRERYTYTRVRVKRMRVPSNTSSSNRRCSETGSGATVQRKNCALISCTRARARAHKRTLCDGEPMRIAWQ